MDKADYLKGISELYGAEIEGEGMATRWLELATDPEQQYKLGLFLQLESEAKVRLRPLLVRYGISLVEDASQRSLGMKEAERLAARPWKEAMGESAMASDLVVMLTHPFARPSSPSPS